MAGRLIRSAAFCLALLVGVSTTLPPAVHGLETTRQGPRLLADAEYFPALLARVREAKRSIDLIMYLWKVTKSPRNKPRQLVQALGEARRRGVRVRVLLEASDYDREINRANQETALLLKKQGIKVFFDNQAVTTHAKLALIDDRFIFLGSHNLTQSALGRNHELSVLVDDPALAAMLSAYLDRLVPR